MKTEDIIGGVLMVLLFLGVTAFIVYYFVKTKPEKNKNTVPPEANVEVWGPPEAGPDKNKSQCLFYNFPTTKITIDSKDVFVPGAPTFDSKVLDSLTGISYIPECLDFDSILASQELVTCQPPADANEKAITRCIKKNGGTTGPGGTDVFYGTNNCPAVATCGSTIGTIAPNYQVPLFPSNSCLSINSGNYLKAVPCDPSDLTQVFRVGKTDPGKKPVNPVGQNKVSFSSSGILTKLQQRVSGLCLAPAKTTSSSNFNPNVIGRTGDSCKSSPFTGFNIELVPCDNLGFYDGYAWLNLPSFSYCSDVNGCQGCFGCSDCKKIPGSNSCSGCQGCTGFESSSVAPVLIYIGDHIDSFPKNSSYQGLTGYNAYYKWALDNNLNGLYYGGSDDQVLTNVLTTETSVYYGCWSFAFATQFLPVTSYNSSLVQGICWNGDLDSGTNNCVNF